MMTRSGSMMRSRILASIFRMLLEDERERFDHFLDGLVELGFGRVLGLHVGHQRYVRFRVISRIQRMEFC
jgi:hypothetical protein